MNVRHMVQSNIVVTVFRWLAAIFFVFSGSLHFVIPEFYYSMMPPFIPFKEFFIVLTGIAEIVFGVGILVPAVQRRSGMSMIALLIAIFPANIYVAIAQPTLMNLEYSPESMWLRLLLQPLFIVWVWWVSVRNTDAAAPVS